MDAVAAELMVAASLSSDARVFQIVFGDSSEMQDELAELVVFGKKRATAGLVRTYQAVGEILPAAGMLFVVRDGRGKTRCLCRITDVSVCAFVDVDEHFASIEGEGDGSLSYWRDVHREFFERDAERNGYIFSDDALVVLQRFEVIARP